MCSSAPYELLVEISCSLPPNSPSPPVNNAAFHPLLHEKWTDLDIFCHVVCQKWGLQIRIEDVFHYLELLRPFKRTLQTLLDSHISIKS